MDDDSKKIERMCRELAEHLKNKNELRESFTAKFIADSIRDGLHLKEK
jgi:hypothetical protein